MREAIHFTLRATWYQPMPRPGMPQPTSATGVVEAARVASHRGAPRCSVRSASILAVFFLRCYRCKWCTAVQPNPIESASRAGCEDESTGLAFFRQPSSGGRKTLALRHSTESGALAVISEPPETPAPTRSLP